MGIRAPPALPRPEQSQPQETKPSYKVEPRVEERIKPPERTYAPPSAQHSNLSSAGNGAGSNKVLGGTPHSLTGPSHDAPIPRNRQPNAFDALTRNLGVNAANGSLAPGPGPLQPLQNKPVPNVSAPNSAGQKFGGSYVRSARYRPGVSPAKLGQQPSALPPLDAGRNLPVLGAPGAGGQGGLGGGYSRFSRY